MTNRPRATLFGHSYCHLCANMQLALEGLTARLGFTLELVDIEGRPDLEAKFGDYVPVLYVGGEEVCHYFLDEVALCQRLGALRGSESDEALHGAGRDG